MAVGDRVVLVPRPRTIAAFRLVLSRPEGGPLRDAPAAAGTFVAFAVVGADAPVAFIPVTAAALHGIGTNAGSASGLLNAVQQLGNAVALAAVSTAMTAGGEAQPGAEFRAGFLCAAFICAAAALVAGRLGAGRGAQSVASGTPLGGTGVEWMMDVVVCP